jgi:type III secretory pathway component EscV
MDFEMIIYIILIVGWFLFSIFKNMKKEEEERQAKKNRTHTVIVEDNGEIKQQKSKKNKAQSSPVIEEVNDGEYFSYETMSERDFEKEFNENVESEISVQHSENQNDGLHLTLDEEEVYKGVVWSEILKRKY